MRSSKSRMKLIAAGLACTVLYPVFVLLPSFLGVANWLAEAGWPLLPILLVLVAARMLLGALVVIGILPRILGWQGNWKSFIGPQGGIRRAILLGLYSFAGFGLLATTISMALGIFKWDLSLVFAFPDIRPDPDVVGLGYFLLALVPAIWEELAFRGLVLRVLHGAFATAAAVLLSSIFFALYHLSNVLVQPPSAALPGVIMALFFGIGWGYLTVRSSSLIPAILAHYLVDSLGQLFLAVDPGDPVRSTGFFLLLTLLFPLANILLAKITYRKERNEEIAHVPVRAR